MYGLEEYYEGLINEAKSPEEIKKILEYQFVKGKGIPADVFDAVFNVDPTKKKSYTRWVLMQWDKYKEDIVKAIKDGQLEKMFKTFKNRANEGLDLTNVENFKRALEYIPDVDVCLDKEGDPNAPENDFDIVYNSPEWVIAVPHTYEADRKLGQGCRWCTAGAFGDNDYYWKRYSSAGPLWVNFDKREKEIGPKDNKEYPYKRYQFLFEWQNWAGELMDSDDDRIDFKDLDMPEAVIDFYGEQNEKYREIIEEGPTDSAQMWEDYNDNRYERSITVLSNSRRDLILMPEQNEEMNLDVDYLLYDSDDLSDNIFNDTFDANDCIVAKSEADDWVILRDTEGYLHIYYDEGGYFEDMDIEKEYKFSEAGLIFAFGRRTELAIISTDDSSFSIIDMDDYFSQGAPSVYDIFYNAQISQAFRKPTLEMISGEDYHSLVSYDGDNFSVLIDRDEPRNGRCYMAEIKGDTISIAGDNLVYEFDQEGNATQNNLSVYDSLFANQNKYYIVIVGGNPSNKNIYDPTTRQLIFEHGYDDFHQLYSNECESLIVCSRPSSEEKGQTYDVIDLSTKKFVIQGSKWFNELFKDGMREETFVVFEKDDKYTAYLLSKTLEPIGTFESIRELRRKDRQPYCIVKFENGSIRAINLSTRAYTIPDGVYMKYGTIRDDCNCVLLQKLNTDLENGVDIYNYVTDKLVTQNCKNGRAVANGVPFIDDNRDVYEIVEVEGKEFNLMDTNGRFILPKNVEKISLKFGNAAGILDNGRFWFLDKGLDLLPSNSGIDASVLQPDMSNGIFVYNGFVIGLSIVDGSVRVSRVTSRAVLDSSTRVKIASEVEQLLYPEKAKIKESFKKMLNKITRDNTKSHA